MPFRLHPPRHGYRGTKLPIKQGGYLGYNGRQDKRPDNQNGVKW